MPKYLLAFNGGGMPETPEEQAAVMAAWGAWYGTLGDAVVDPGAPIGASSTHRTRRRGDPGGWRLPRLGLHPDLGREPGRRRGEGAGLPHQGQRRQHRGGRDDRHGDVTLRPRPRLTPILLT